MKKTLRILSYIVVGFLAWILIFIKTNDVQDSKDFSYKLKARVMGPCSVPLYYSLGEIDERFGLSKDEFKTIVQEAENVWEEKLNKNLFEFKEDADFKINLVFDERQLGTLERKKLDIKLENAESQQQNISSEYNKLIAEYDDESEAYQKNLNEYNEELEDYQDEVKFWNKRGGAPEDEYEDLKDKAEELQDWADELQKDQKEINDLVKKINALVNESQRVANDYNHEAETYKDKFGESHEFDQGLYTGEEINIYQFSEESDLILVIAHELGHYLGLDHLENPSSVMYYLMGEQDLEDISLTNEDLSAVENVCGQ